MHVIDAHAPYAQLSVMCWLIPAAEISSSAHARHSEFAHAIWPVVHALRMSGHQDSECISKHLGAALVVLSSRARAAFETWEAHGACES